MVGWKKSNNHTKETLNPKTIIENLKPQNPVLENPEP
jgi:hypothetical protein